MSLLDNIQTEADGEHLTGTFLTFQPFNYVQVADENGVIDMPTYVYGYVHIRVTDSTGKVVVKRIRCTQDKVAGIPSGKRVNFNLYQGKINEKGIATITQTFTDEFNAKYGSKHDDKLKAQFKDELQKRILLRSIRIGYIEPVADKTLAEVIKELPADSKLTIKWS